jgi:hypothetical protein
MAELSSSLHQRNDVAFPIRHIDQSGRWQRRSLFGDALIVLGPPHTLLDAAPFPAASSGSRVHILASITPNGSRSGVTA